MLPGAAGNPPRQIFLPARSVSQVNFKKKRHRWHSKETSWSNDLSVGVAGFLLGGGVNWLGTYNKWVLSWNHPKKKFDFPTARYFLICHFFICHFFICHFLLAILLPGMVMVLSTFWACEPFSLMGGLSRSPQRRLRWEKLLPQKDFYASFQILSPTPSTVAHKIFAKYL